MNEQFNIQTNALQNMAVSAKLSDTTKNVQVQMENLNIQHQINGSIAITGLPNATRISRELFEDSDFVSQLKLKIKTELEDSLKKQLV